MRRAEWRRRADDPTGPLGWWWSSFRTRKLHGVYLLPVGCAVVAGFLGAGWWLLAMALAAWAFALSHPVKEVDRLAAILPDPAPEGQFRAQVVYRRNGMVTGRDEVALAMVDGWLHAEGVRSTFSIRAEDIDGVSGWNDRGCTLTLVDGGTIVLRGFEDRDRRVTQARWAIEAWQRDGARPEGEPTFPPARAHPQEMARWAAWVFVGGMTWPTLNLIGALVSSGAEGRIRFMLAGLVVGGAVAGMGAIRLRRLLQIDAQAKGGLAQGASPLQVGSGRTLIEESRTEVRVSRAE